MKNFYLQTLEGVPRFGAVSEDRKTVVFNNFNFLVTRDPDITAISDETRRFYNAFLRLESAFTLEEIRTLWEGNKLKDSARKAVELYENQKEAERERDERDAQRRADMERKEREEEQRLAQEEAEREREARDELKRQAVEQAKEIINEGNSMAQNIPALDETDVNISTQLVTSGQEFTVVDETPETIAYVDEAGELHVDQKEKSGLGWLIAGVAALFLLT